MTGMRWSVNTLRLQLDSYITTSAILESWSQNHFSTLMYKFDYLNSAENVEMSTALRD